MSYTVRNFKSKKALKDTLKFIQANPNDGIGPIRCYNPGFGPDLSNWSGSVYLEGPHYPEAHKWYAQGVMKDGILIKVK